MAATDLNTVVSSTKDYYDGPADEIYRTIWGDNIHLGVPPERGGSHLEAMEHTNRIMAAEVNLTPGTRVIDLGCGYGATARFLAREFGCPVLGTNISEKELDLARERAKQAGLESLLTFEYGDFHKLKYPDQSFEVVWSQEAFLHGAHKPSILSECFRVLKRGGAFAFTDILVRADTPAEDRTRIYERVKSPDMWDADDYERALVDAGFKVRKVQDWSEHVAPSYGWIRDRLKANQRAMEAKVGAETVARTIEALSFWVDSAKAGRIGWALFVAERPT